MKFTELNLEPKLLEAISYMGFENATPVQELAIPVVLKNQDLIACAQTGTGKTAAFILPILNKLIGKEDQSTDTLIVVPTRELAVQIEQQIQGLSYFISVTSAAVYGGGSGSDWEQEKRALTQGADIIVATPGKLLSHLKMGYVKFDKVKHLILDEADRMLDMGFVDDINKIITYLPKQHQSLLFSATMPASIHQLASSILHDPFKIALSISKPAAGVDQKAFLTFDNQKIDLIKHLLKERDHYDSILVFSSTKSKVSEIARELSRNGLKASAISSNLDQNQREEVLRGFRSKRIRILVATDVMSRGIDIKEINLVINYDVPNDAEDYVHRVGRTARAKTKGEAITFIQPRDMYAFSIIEELIENQLEKRQPPDSLGAGPKWDPKPFKKTFSKKPFNKSGSKKGGKKFYSKNKNHKK
jgi:superfamily II DNA/RNA helicase